MPAATFLTRLLGTVGRLAANPLELHPAEPQQASEPAPPLEISDDDDAEAPRKEAEPDATPAAQPEQVPAVCRSGCSPCARDRACVCLCGAQLAARVSRCRLSSREQALLCLHDGCVCGAQAAPADAPGPGRRGSGRSQWQRPSHSRGRGRGILTRSHTTPEPRARTPATTAFVLRGQAAAGAEAAGPLLCRRPQPQPPRAGLLGPRQPPYRP